MHRSSRWHVKLCKSAESASSAVPSVRPVWPKANGRPRIPAPTIALTRPMTQRGRVESPKSELMLSRSWSSCGRAVKRRIGAVKRRVGTTFAGGWTPTAQRRARGGAADSRSRVPGYPRQLSRQMTCWLRPAHLDTKQIGQHNRYRSLHTYGQEYP